MNNKTDWLHEHNIEVDIFPTAIGLIIPCLGIICLSAYFLEQNQ